jgi:antitoxin HicB
MDKYPFQITELSEDNGNGFLITFPDLPGCMSDGDTIEEARVNASQALGDWLAARKKLGKPIPLPSPPIRPHDYSGKYLQRLPKSIHAQLASRAEREGVSLNQLAASYITAGLASSFVADEILVIDHGQHGKTMRRRKPGARKGS